MKKKCIWLLFALVLLFGLSMTAYGAEASDPENASDSSLSYLRVIPGELSPEFSSDVTEYSVTVEPNHTKLAVTAKTTADTSKFVVSNTYLEVGTNIITVKVTAEDGSLTTYTLNVLRPEDGSNTGESVQTEAPETPAPTTEAPASDKGKSGIPVWVFFLLGLAIGGIVLTIAVKMATKQLAMMEENEKEEETEELEYKEIEAVEEPNPGSFFEFLDSEEPMAEKPDDEAEKSDAEESGADEPAAEEAEPTEAPAEESEEAHDDFEFFDL